MKTKRLLFVVSTTLCLSVDAATLYWDTNLIDPGSGDAGGDWSVAAGNWNALAAGTGAEALFTNGDSVVFAAGTDSVTPRTVTILGTVSTPSILLDDVALVTLASGAIDVTGGSVFDTSVLGSATDRSLDWSSNITGTGILTLRAHGSTSDSGDTSNSELRLSGSNDFIGNPTIVSGLVNLSSNFGNAANQIILNGGGLVDEGQNLSITRNILIGAAGGVIRSAAATTTTLSGVIENSAGVALANLRHTDGGILRLAGDGSGFVGVLANGGGELQVTAPAADWSATDFDLKSSGGNLVFNGGGTAKAKSISTVADHTLVENGTTLDVPSYSIIPTLASGISSNLGAVGTNGKITSSTGTLTISNGQFATGTLGTNGHQVYLTIGNADGSTPLTLVKDRNNGLSLTRANTYSGGTIIHAGRIDATDLAGFGTGKVTVNSGGQAYLSKGGVYANDFELTGIGPAEATATRGALRFATASTSGNITVTAAGARITAASGTLGRMSGALSGNGPLEINSNDANVIGTISLTGSGSAYTGTVSVSQGRFNFSGVLGGSVNVAPTITDATLGGGTSLTGNLTLNSTTKKAKFANANGTLAIGGNLTLTGANPVVLTKPAPGTASVTLMTYGGTLTGTAANLVLDNAASYRGTPVFDVSTPGQVRLTGLNGQNLTWSGASGAWDIETSSNWNSGTTTFSFGDAVTFTDAGVTKAVTLATTLEPQSVTVNNSAGNDYTFTGGGLAGNTGLTKSGTGTWNLGGASTFTGPINVTAGRLKLTTATALGFNSGIAISSGAQVDINGQSPGATTTIISGGYSYSIAGNGDGSGAIVNTGASIADARAGVRILNLTADASIGTNTRFDVGYDTKSGIGSIQGGGFILTKKGTGEIRFRAPATNVSVVVESGLLVAQEWESALGGPSGLVTVSPAGQLATNGALAIPTPVSFADGATLSNTGGGTGLWSGLLTVPGTLNLSTAGGDIAITGGISGAGTILKSGINTLILDAAANPFVGKYNVSAGMLRIASDAALGAPPAALVADAITLSGGTLQGGTLAGPGSAIIGHPNRGISATTGLTWDPGAGNTLTLNSPVTGSGSMSIATPGTVAFNQPVALTGGFSVLAGTASFANSLVLSAAGEILVDSGGTAIFGSSANPSTLRVRAGTVNIGPGAAISVNRIVTNDADQTISTINQTGGSVTITGTDNTNTTSSSFLMGHWASTDGDYNLSGGTLNAPGTLLSLGWDSTNVSFNQSGGTANLLGINLGNSRANQAAYRLTGGRLNLGSGGITAEATKIVSFGGGTVGAFADWSSAQPIDITGEMGATTIDTLDAVDAATPRTIVLTGSLFDGGALIKSGAGTLSLEAPSSGYFGACTIQAGTVRVSGEISSATFSPKTGGTIAPGTLATPGTGTVGALDLDAGTAAFRLLKTGGDKLVVTTTNGFKVTAPSTISATPVGVLAVNDVIPVVDYDGTIDGLSMAGLSLQMTNPHYSGVLVNNSVTTALEVKITAVTPLLWKGNLGSAWDLNNTSNWQLEGSGTSSKFLEYDFVKFTDAGAATPVVTLAGSIQPSAVEFDASVNYTLGGDPIVGACGLTKKNSGKATLTNANTYTGATTIAAGTLEIGNGGATGSLGATTIANQATLAINRSDAVTFSNNVSGAGQLVKRGSGELSLTGTNTFTGPVIVEAGTLLATNPATAFGTTAAGITVQAGATLNINGQTMPAGETVTAAGNGVGGYAVAGNGNLPANIALTANATFGNDAAGSLNVGTGTAPVTITGGHVLTKAGANRIWYRGPNNGAGNSVAALVITGGTFGIETGNNALNGVPVTVHPAGILSSWGSANGAAATTQNNPITLNGGVLGSDYNGDVWSGPVTLTANSTLGVEGSAQNFTISGSIGQSGGIFGLIKNTASAVTLSAINTYTGNTTVNAGSLVLADNAGLKFAIGANGVNNKITGIGAATLNGDFTLDLTAAAIANGNSWTLVDTTTKSFSATFSVLDFTESADVWTKTDGTKTWTFSEATGVLTLAVSGSTGFSTWADLYAPGQTPDMDHDLDGIDNGVEYFMGATGSSFTANPGVVAGKVVWPKNASFVGSYAVQTSPNLSTWTTATAGVVDLGTSVQYTLPVGAGKHFVRLIVTPN